MELHLTGSKLPEITDEVVSSSSALENLISQNEDLMARLKVALRRLSAIEDENKKLNEYRLKLETELTALKDRASIDEQKEASYWDKLRQVEAARLAAEEKCRALEEKLHKASLEISRYNKYHERIRNHVRPHINELKVWAQNLEQRLKEAQQNLDRKDLIIRDLRHQILEVTRHSAQQVEVAETRLREAIAEHERTTAHLRGRIDLQSEAIVELENRVRQLEGVSIRLSETENQLIALEKLHKETLGKNSEEREKLQKKNVEIQAIAARQEMELKDLKAQALENFEKIKNLQQTETDLKSQLESLRYLWNCKNEECEKLRASLAALERLNAELSRRLQQCGPD
ncbi:MAG: hypothetical protein N2578_08505 [Bdellovibrionaceae bacterium]|nr:hypothetical protein [Pseudobdellovibrionaceae bacterium]